MKMKSNKGEILIKEGYSYNKPKQAPPEGKPKEQNNFLERIVERTEIILGMNAVESYLSLGNIKDTRIELVNIKTETTEFTLTFDKAKNLHIGDKIKIEMGCSPIE